MPGELRTRTVRVRRVTGDVAEVVVADAPHYEVAVWNEAAGEERYEVVVAPSAPAARRVARRLMVDGDELDGVRRLTPAEVAVAVLHGAHVVADRG